MAGGEIRRAIVSISTMQASGPLKPAGALPVLQIQGYRGFFNQRGDVLQRTEYWVPAAIQGEIRANDELTFYARYGDYLSRTAVWLAAFVLLAAFVKNKLLR